MLSDLNPGLSKMPTTEGNMSLSNNKRLLAIDAFKFIGNRGKRLMNKLSQKIFKTPFLSFASANHPEYYDHMRTLNVYKEAIAVFKGEGILNKQLKSENISDRYTGSIVSLYMLKSYLGNINSPNKI